MEGNTHLKWNEHSTVIPTNLHNMLERKLFVDLTLAIDEGLSIPVHQVILCAASPYFKDLLSQHPADVHTTIILSDISFEHLTALVEFIYKGNVSVPCCQLSALLEAASSLKIKGLIDTIEDSQLQQGHLETHQPESDEGTLLKIVSVKSIVQMPSEEPMSCWENSDETVKEEVDYDSDDTVLHEPEDNLISGDGATELANELLPLPSPNASTYSTGRKSHGSSSKKKGGHQHQSSFKTNFSTCTTISKRKSVEDKEAGSSAH